MITANVFKPLFDTKVFKLIKGSMKPKDSTWPVKILYEKVQRVLFRDMPPACAETTLKPQLDSDAVPSKARSNIIA